MDVYAFNYCPDRYESGYITMSLHKTKLGAYKTMRLHKLERWCDESTLYVHNWKKEDYGGKGYYDHLLENEGWRIETLHLED